MEEGQTENGSRTKTSLSPLYGLVLIDSAGFICPATQLCRRVAPKRRKVEIRWQFKGIDVDATANRMRSLGKNLLACIVRF